MFPTRPNTTHNYSNGRGASTQGVIPGGGVDVQAFGIGTEQIEAGSLHPGTLELNERHEIFRGNQESYIRGLSKAAVVEPEAAGEITEYNVPERGPEQQAAAEQDPQQRHAEAVRRVAVLAEQLSAVRLHALSHFTREHLDSRDDFTLAA